MNTIKQSNKTNPKNLTRTKAFCKRVTTVQSLHNISLSTRQLQTKKDGNNCLGRKSVPRIGSSARLQDLLQTDYYNRLFIND